MENVPSYSPSCTHKRTWFIPKHGRDTGAKCRLLRPVQTYVSARTSMLASAMMVSTCLLGGCNSETDVEQPMPVSALVCDDSLKTAFKPDAETTVLLVKAFKTGEPLLLSGSATSTTPVASNDVCVVKLNVGPGNPGSVDAPSTSSGIGIEVWLPSAANWNNRIHIKGGGGFVGGAHTSIAALAGLSTSSSGSVAATAMVEGAISASTDAGHANTTNGGSFGMSPSGAINTTLWIDFAERAVHQMAVKTKALARAYYGTDARYSYFNGFSTGGIQAHREAQTYPEDFDGIMAGAPAINAGKFTTAELYPQVVVQRDLGGVALTSEQRTLVSLAAINTCDVVGGQHLGYIADPSQCFYDPTIDLTVICASEGGTNATASCVSPAQARAFNKFWYGQTPDGSVPSPAADIGFGISPTGSQLWYGLARGTSLSNVAGASPSTLATDFVALELQDPTLGTPSFINATGDGVDGWKNLTFANLAHAFERGIALQPAFNYINTDNPDLSKFRDGNKKMIVYHGLSDTLIPVQGTINYYHRVANQMGGLAALQNFYRLYLVPGMGHGFSNGTANPTANPPLPSNAQIYALLTDWVERGTVPPQRVEIVTVATAANPVQKSRPICVYPLKANFVGGDPNTATSYTCS